MKEALLFCGSNSFKLAKLPLKEMEKDLGYSVKLMVVTLQDTLRKKITDKLSFISSTTTNCKYSVF